jgi:mono/diheme cytochrome c family protein
MNKTSAIFIVLMLMCAGAFAQKASKQSIEKGKLVYEQYCLTCHQVDGSGVPNLNPPLIKTSFVLGDKKKIIGIVLKGLNDVEVNGETYSNPMPPFDFMSDEEIADVLTYVRNSFTNKGTAVTAAEVKANR